MNLFCSHDVKQQGVGRESTQVSVGESNTVTK